MWTSFLLLLLLVTFGACVIPRQCVHELRLPPGHPRRICCPSRCGGPARGLCVPVRLRWGLPGEVRYHTFHFQTYFDDRLQWPIRLFHRVCRCRPNFSGPDCRQCAPGHSGRRCEKFKPRMRKNIEHMSRRQQRDYQRVLDAARHMWSDYYIFDDLKRGHTDPIRRPVLRRARVHQAVVYLHQYPSRPTQVHRSVCGRIHRWDYSHVGLAFATWHRAFLLWWETQLLKVVQRLNDNERRRLLREKLRHRKSSRRRRRRGHRRNGRRQRRKGRSARIIRNFAIPYWDWTGKDGCTICTDSVVGETNRHGYFNRNFFMSRWKEYCPSPSHCGGCNSFGRLAPMRRKWIRHRFPGERNVRAVLKLPRYVRTLTDYGNMKKCHGFAAAIEGFCNNGANGQVNPHLYMHNYVHTMVRGSFGEATASPNDPLFMLHHAQTDRLFEKWLRHHGHKQGNYLRRSRNAYDNFALPTRYQLVGQCGLCNLVGFIQPITHAELFKESRKIGVVYDSMKFGSIP
nr:tyrosinase 1 [Theama mediterranea]